jgi:tetratricopeptide (TPR) repeat protein
MKKQSIKYLASLLVLGTFLGSCDLLKDLEYKVTPNPLEMHGDSVRVRVDVVFPQKGIKKKASVEVTPMLGNTALKSVTILGEKATGNGSNINYKAGGKFTYEDVVKYSPEFENADLKVTGKVYKGAKEKAGQFTETKLADATIITPLMVNKDFKVVLAKDELKRVNENTFVAQINYEKGKSVVRPNELKEKDITDLSKWFTSAQTNSKIIIKSINVTGFASPEGEEDKNNTLSTDRANAGKTVALNLAKKAKNDKAQTEIYNLIGRGEDYEGFKRELQASTSINNDEKNLVIRVLEMYKDPVTREKEMQNMGKTFTDLDKNIFPKLRRSEISVVYDLAGLTDDELKSLSVSQPDSLTIEELLFTATLTDDLNEKLRIYNLAIQNYPDDYRGHNNAGAILFMQHKLDEARNHFEKANNLKDNAISKNNLAAVAGATGDRVKAKKLLSQAKGAGPEVSYNTGIINIQDGKYADAIANLGSENTFNKALAQLLNGSTDVAVKTIDGSTDKESAQGYYLKAIASSRLNKVDGVLKNLNNAIKLDSQLKAKALNDREFLKYSENLKSL